jgi:hypothetical protein
MLNKFNDLDVADSGRIKTDDESPYCKTVEQLVDVAGVVRQHFGFDALRSVFQTSGAVSHAPESSEQQAPERRHFCQRVVREERRLDIASPHARKPPMPCEHRGPEVTRDIKEGNARVMLQTET